MSDDDWDDLAHPDDAPRTQPAEFVVRVCSRGHEKTGTNLAIVHRKTYTEYRCVKCHRARQRKCDRARAAKTAA